MTYINHVIHIQEILSNPPSLEIFHHKLTLLVQTSSSFPALHLLPPANKPPLKFHSAPASKPPPPPPCIKNHQVPDDSIFSYHVTLLAAATADRLLAASRAELFMRGARAPARAARGGKIRDHGGPDVFSAAPSRFSPFLL